MNPLIKASTGSMVKITNITGGCSFLQRISEMGIGINSVVKIVKNDGVGPIIVGINSMRVALGRGMCRRIYYEKQ